MANLVTRTALDLCADKPDGWVSWTDLVEASGVSKPVARAYLAGLTVATKRRCKRRNWPLGVQWNVDGSQQAFYSMSAATAERWRKAVIHLDAEQSDDELESPAQDADASAR
jgi:hypothetical protein